MTQQDIDRFSENKELRKLLKETTLDNLRLCFQFLTYEEIQELLKIACQGQYESFKRSL